MNWNNELQASRSHDAVLGVVNDFISEQDDRFWSRVPQKARPEPLATPSEIHQWHHALVQALKRQRPTSLELQELCVLFLRASVRLHQLDLRDDAGNAPSNDELGCAPAHRSPRRRA